MLEAIAVLGSSTRAAEIAVDDVDPFNRPAEGDGPFTQRILALRALGILEHLAQGGLAHVEIGVATQVLGADLL